MNSKNILMGIGIALFVVVLGWFVMESGKGARPPTPGAREDISLDESTSEIVGEWQWNETQMSDGGVTAPAIRGSFVLTLSASGEASSTTDCNSLSGTYKLMPDNGIQFSQFASTMMACEGSVEGEYARDLMSANSYSISGEELWLMLPFDSGTMIFTRIN